MKLRRLKCGRKAGEGSVERSQGRVSGRGPGDRGGAEPEGLSEGGGSVEQRTSAASAHRPKIRVPGDAPRKLKIMASSISSKGIMRSEQKEKPVQSYSKPDDNLSMNIMSPVPRHPENSKDLQVPTNARADAGSPQPSGPRKAGKLILKQADIKLSPNGRRKLQESSGSGIHPEHNEEQQRR